MRTLFATILLAAACTSSPAENLIKNSSFETGYDGYYAWATYSWVSILEHPGTPPVFDRSAAFHGQASLKMVSEDKGPFMQQVDGVWRNRGKEHHVNCIFDWIKVDPGKKYTLSAYLKSDTKDFTVFLGALPNEKKTITKDGAGLAPMNITTDWKRYIVSFTAVSSPVTVWIKLGSRPGTVWMDAVQLEEGELTDYSGEDFDFGVSSNGNEKETEARPGVADPRGLPTP